MLFLEMRGTSMPRCTFTHATAKNGTMSSHVSQPLGSSQYVESSSYEMRSKSSELWL